MGADGKKVKNKACTAQPLSWLVLLFRPSFSYKVFKARKAFMLIDSLSLWLILSPGPADACTACWPAANLQASLGKTQGEKNEHQPSGLQGTQAKGSPSRQAAPSLAAPIANTLAAEPTLP